MKSQEKQLSQKANEIKKQGNSGRKYSAQFEGRNKQVVEPGRNQISASIGMTASPRSGEDAPKVVS